jgi:hypothetical protein
MWKAVAGVVLCGICLILLPRAIAQTNPAPAEMKVTGTLSRVVGIGGETTGWAIRLDRPTNVRGKELRSIEVIGNARDLLKLQDKRVEASGQIVVRHGVERGEWSVLEISALKAA